MKKIISLLICLVMIFALSACSKDDDETSKLSTIPQTSETTVEPIFPVEEETDAPSEEAPSTPDESTTAMEVAVTNSTKKTASGVKISWAPVNGATGYKIYRSETKDGKKELIAQTKDTTYVDKTAGDKTYSYSIQAIKPTTTKATTAPATKAPSGSTTSQNPVATTSAQTTNATTIATTSATTKPTTASSGSTTLPVSGTVYEKVRAQFRNQIVSNPTISAQTLVKNLMSTAGMSTLSYKVDVVQQNQTVPTYYIAPCGNDCNVKAADCKSAYYAYPKNSSGSNSPATRLYIFQANDSSKASSIASEIKRYVHTDYQMCGAPAAENYIVDNYNNYVLLFLK